MSKISKKLVKIRVLLINTNFQKLEEPSLLMVWAAIRTTAWVGGVGTTSADGGAGFFSLEKAQLPFQSNCVNRGPQRALTNRPLLRISHSWEFLKNYALGRGKCIIWRSKKTVGPTRTNGLWTYGWCGQCGFHNKATWKSCFILTGWPGMETLIFYSARSKWNRRQILRFFS